MDRQAKDARGAHIEPSEVEADDGQVIVDGPDGVAVTLTPDAAIETSERLLDAGFMAQGQNVEAGRAKPPTRKQQTQGRSAARADAIDSTDAD